MSFLFYLQKTVNISWPQNESNTSELQRNQYLIFFCYNNPNLFMLIHNSLHKNFKLRNKQVSFTQLLFYMHDLHTGPILLQHHKNMPIQFDPLNPHFYKVKMGFTGIYIFFLFLLNNIDCGYSLEQHRRGDSNEHPQSIFWAEIWKNIRIFIWKLPVFGGENFNIFE